MADGGTIFMDEASARAAAVPPSNAPRLADSLFERMVDGHEAFWSLVYPLSRRRT